VKTKLIGFAAVIALLLFGSSYLWVGASTPQGQDPLFSLTSSNFAEFEESFDMSLEGPRLVLLLSPT